MESAHRDTRVVTIESLEWGFLNSFSTATNSFSIATVSTCYLRCDADVRSARAVAPATTREGVPT